MDAHRRQRRLLARWVGAHHEAATARRGLERQRAVARQQVAAARAPYDAAGYARLLAYLDDPSTRGHGPDPALIVRLRARVEHTTRVATSEVTRAARAAKAARAREQRAWSALCAAVSALLLREGGTTQAPQGTRSVPNTPPGPLTGQPQLPTGNRRRPGTGSGSSFAVGFSACGEHAHTIDKECTTMTDTTARLAEIQAAESKALTAVATAETTLTRERERMATAIAKQEAKLAEVRATHEATLAEIQTELEQAQGQFALVAGPDRAAQVLGISPTAARARRKAAEDAEPDAPADVTAHGAVAGKTSEHEPATDAGDEWRNVG